MLVRRAFVVGWFLNRAIFSLIWKHPFTTLALPIRKSKDLEAIIVFLNLQFTTRLLVNLLWSNSCNFATVDRDTNPRRQLPRTKSKPVDQTFLFIQFPLKGQKFFILSTTFRSSFCLYFKKNVFLAVRQVVCGSSRLVRRAVGGRWTAGGAATCISLNGEDRDDGNGDDDHHPTRFSEVYFVTWRNLLKIVGSRTTMICKTSFSLIKPSLRCS